MIEFIIRGEIEEDFGLHADLWADALRPVGIPCRHLPGFGQDHLRAEVDGCIVSFSPEPPGWQVSFEGTPDLEWANRIAHSICDNMSRVSGQKGVVVPI